MKNREHLITTLYLQEGAHEVYLRHSLQDIEKYNHSFQFIRTMTTIAKLFIPVIAPVILSTTKKRIT